MAAANPDPNTRFFGFRMPLPMAEKVEDVLVAESLQITEYVRSLIREDLRKRGLLSPDDDGSQLKLPLPGRAVKL